MAAAAAAASRRKETDVMKLIMSDFEVALDDGKADQFTVKLHGPADSPWEGGIFRVHVNLPAAYPYKSPSIGFGTTVFHPNVDERSGSVCLDVINQAWSPMFDLVNVFEVFLPQLLQYPNPADPLNGEAARLALRDPAGYERRVRDYIRRFASEDFHLGVERVIGLKDAAPVPRKLSGGSSGSGNGGGGGNHSIGSGRGDQELRIGSRLVAFPSSPDPNVGSDAGGVPRSRSLRIVRQRLRRARNYSTRSLASNASHSPSSSSSTPSWGHNRGPWSMDGQMSDDDEAEGDCSDEAAELSDVDESLLDQAVMDENALMEELSGARNA